MLENEEETSNEKTAMRHSISAQCLEKNKLIAEKQAVERENKKLQTEKKEITQEGRKNKALVKELESKVECPVCLVAPREGPV